MKAKRLLQDIMFKLVFGEKLANDVLEREYFRPQILERVSIGEYWNISGVHEDCPKM